MSDNCPPAYNGCNCICHIKPGVMHARPCCRPANSPPARPMQTVETRAREVLAHEYSEEGQPSVALAILSGELRDDSPYAVPIRAMVAFASAPPDGESGKLERDDAQIAMQMITEAETLADAQSIAATFLQGAL